MAYLVVNSKYNPFTFDEMVKPFTMYGEEYNRQEAAANELATKAAILENLSPETDKAQYDSYKSWLGELQQASAALAASGLNPELRSTLATLNNRYSSEYAPLEERIKKRSSLVDEQRAYQQKNPGAFFDVDYANTPLSEISPSSTYKTYDLEDILTKVGKDVYNRSYNGEMLPTAEQYLEKYGKGLTDPAKIGMVSEPINSGMSLGSATYREKALEESLSRARIRASRGSGSTNSSSKAPQLLYTDSEGNAYYGQGNLVWAEDKDGNTIISPTTAANLEKQRKTGETQGSNQQTQLNPSIGVIYFNEKGEVKRHASATQWNNDSAKVAGTPANSAADLSEENIMRLANELGLSEEEAINEDYVFNLARARGITIDVIGPATNEKKVRKEGQRGRTKEDVSNPKQQMILTGHSFSKTGTVNQEEWTGDEL